MLITSLAWSAAGLALLIAGAELIVRGGVAVAARLGLSPLVIGLTIVAIGTSTPELAVGIDAALIGEGELAVGNIVGANLVNILLILGLSALLQPLAIRSQTVRMELPVILLASLTLWVATADGGLSRTDGLVFVLAALAYTGLLLLSARRERLSGGEAGGASPAAASGEAALPGTALSLLFLGAGIAIVVLGADWLVTGAVGLARQWGVSDAFIGLTIVALGTTAPEFVTTMIATARGTRDIAIGNLLGSSVYNILFILGIACLVPAGGIPVGPELLRVDIPLMIAVALVCVPVFITGRLVSRLEGGLFVTAYAIYFAWLLATRS